MVQAAMPVGAGLCLLSAIGGGRGEGDGWVAEAWSKWVGRWAVGMEADALSSWGSIGRMAGNGFESVVFGQVPSLRTAFEALASTHPLVCRMTGSGSSLFAVYRNAGDREDARMRLGRKHGTTIPVQTLVVSP